METILEYLKKYGNISFKEMKFNEVDALILSQFVYLKWDRDIPGIMDAAESVSLAELQEKMDRSFVFCDERYLKKNLGLFEGMAGGKRFGNMKCNYYTNIVDEVVETQFCALTVFPEDAHPVVIFRGTDETIIGWKEDFNMAFEKPVAGQRLAALYLNQVAMKFQEPFQICGHSKGGNLAVYSALNAQESLQTRIEKIYSFDGPGFRKEVLDCEDFARISGKICKLIPHSSLVGMLLEKYEDYEVVDSYYFGVLQHDPYSWKIHGKKVKRVSQMDRARLLKSEAFNEWLLQLNEHQLLLFVDTMFDILKETDIKTTRELQGDLKNSLTKILEVGKQMDEQSREDLLEMAKSYFEILCENTKDYLTEK